MKPFTLDDIKHIIDYSVDIGPTGHTFIDDRYQAHIDKFGEPFPYYRLFFHLAQRLEPLLTVELGGWQGTAASHFAQGYTDGIVFTIDHHTDLGDDQNKIKMLEVEKHHPNMTYLQGWTRPDLAESQKGKHDPILGDALSVYHIIEDCVKRGKAGIDILFIDSWHNYDEAMADWKAYEPLLSDLALVICDDISSKNELPAVGMWEFWEEMTGEKFLEDRMHIGVPMGFMRYERT